jgi:hypothetical protein
MFGKIVQRLFEPGACFFGDIGNKVVDNGDDRSAPVKRNFVLFDLPSV